jgi:hypothetical protein
VGGLARRARLLGSCHVKLVQANVRQAEIEALRMADRLLHDERTDPSIEKQVIIQGGPTVPVVPVDDPN